MMTADQDARLVDAVEKVFVAQRGALRRDDIHKVFSALLEETRTSDRNDAEKMAAHKHIPELIGVNLDFALSEYCWDGCAPVSDGRVVLAVLELNDRARLPAGYRWDERHRYLSETGADSRKR